MANEIKSLMKIEDLEWLESKLERVVEKLIGCEVQQKPFAHGKLISRDDYISLYQGIYCFLCQDDADANGSKLYDKFKQLLQRSIQNVFHTHEKPLEKKSSNLGSTGANVLVGKGEEGLETFLEKLKTFKHKMLVFSHVFAYMERYFIPKMSLSTLEEVIITELDEQVLKKASPQLKIELANLADKRRDGKPVSEDLFVEVVAVFLEISPRTDHDEEESTRDLQDLEDFLLHRTGAYYAKKATQWPQDSLMKKVEQATSYEKDFAEMFLPKKSLTRFEERLVEIMEDVIAIKLQNVDRRDDKLSVNLENSMKVSSPLLSCSTHHKLQEPSNSTIMDALRTANV